MPGPTERWGPASLTSVPDRTGKQGKPGKQGKGRGNGKGSCVPQTPTQYQYLRLSPQRNAPSVPAVFHPALYQFLRLT